MNEYNPNFPANLLLEYLEHGPADGLKRFQTYTLYRLFSALSKKDASIAASLYKQLGKKPSLEDFSMLTDYLESDFYFSPSFVADSFDPFFLYCAISVTNGSEDGSILLDPLLSKYCKEALTTCYDDASFTLDFVYEDDTAFWAALYICLTGYEAELPELLPEFSRIYWDDLKFTCGDFVLYDFMDEYFEVKDSLHKAEFTELIQTLVLAVLQSFNTDLEQFTMDALFQLKHPSSRFCSLYSFGAIDISALPPLDTASRSMQHILEYAAAYELRNNLYDYHLGEDNTITLTNWKENLKWHYVQYTNVYNLALDSFYSASLSHQLLKKQFETNIKEVSLCES